MHQDQAFVFKSSDPVNHNVQLCGFTNAPFNQILAPNGTHRSKLVAERRPIAVACDIHPWMKGYIMVFDHPFFAVTAEDGSFEIKGVPAGEPEPGHLAGDGRLRESGEMPKGMRGHRSRGRDLGMRGRSR